MKARSKNRTLQAPDSANVIQSSPWRDCILLAIGVLLFCGIYFNKAYNMDDPLVVWTAKRIAVAPADFYGFDVNWYGFYAPMNRVDLNPPGAAYYTAIFGKLFHWRESAMHGALALAAIALVIGIYWLARRMGGAPLQTAIFALVCPGIFVSMGTVMADLLMLALWVWAIVLWLRGLDKENPGLNAASGVLIGLAALTKYFACSLVPLLIVYTFLYERKRWARMAWLIIPVVMVGLFELYTQMLFGVGHIRGIFGLAEPYYNATSVNHFKKILTGIAFLGAGAAPALFLAPWLWRRAERKFLWWVSIISAGLATAILWQCGWQPGELQVQYKWWFWLQYWLWLFAGIHIVAVVIAEFRVWRNRDAVLLALWMGGTLFYCIVFYYVVNIRVLVPAFPVVALTCMRRLRRIQAERKGGAPVMSKAPVWGALAAGLALSLCVARADIMQANSARSAAEKIAPEKRSGSTWFSGHWGFQYYMEAHGAKPIDAKNPELKIGDTLVTPENAANRFPPPPSLASEDQSFALPVCNWITTMRIECGAGFHANFWGPLPFVFGQVPPEQYQVIIISSR